tara:strand:+ start:794 stop:1078 length:285 start_codon:yes stop_codon:yes gene_type:complete
MVQRNSDTSDDDAVKYLKNLRSLDTQTVSEYFIRSTNIINKMRELGVDTDQTWDSLDQSHLKEILSLIYQQNFNAVVPSIRKMLSNLESQYEVQ